MIVTVGVHQRWAESEKLTPNPIPKTKTPPDSLQILDPACAHFCHATCSCNIYQCM